MINVNGKQVAVLGLGKSGLAAAKLLSLHGAQVVVLDDKTPEKLSTWIEKAQGLSRTRLALGGGNMGELSSCDLVVTSPGVPLNHPILELAFEKGLPVVGEMELAFGYCAAPVAAVTGTNGKTTTTTLLAQMILQGGRKAVACGNIGTAFAEAVFGLTAEDVAVLEVSSFQLETIKEFHPHVAAILNVTPDHLDRHGSMQTYVQAKARIFENQGEGDAVLLNVSDKYTPLFSSMAHSRVYAFGFPKEGRGEKKPGCYAEGDRLELLGRELVKISALRIPGPHNVENACAAALAASLMGAPDRAIAQILEKFEGVEHRLEDAGEIDGVRFVNDSKGTNVDSVAKALESFPRPIVLILGGRDKEGDFTRLIPLIQEKVTRVVAFGECKAKVAAQLSPAVTVVEAGALEETVKGALAVSEKGGTVLFSPGCASYDMFLNYEDRGLQFKALVKHLRESRLGATQA